MSRVSVHPQREQPRGRAEPLDLDRVALVGAGDDLDDGDGLDTDQRQALADEQHVVDPRP
jgi:hypothetical protein